MRSLAEPPASSIVAWNGPDDALQLPSPGEAREELRRVLGSTAFDASDRNRRFLEYVTEEMLAGRGDRIKAYNVATEVFRREVDFDPQLDPVVRMEARRLRLSLERYYLTDGKQNRLRISMPKGGYVPQIVDVTPDREASEPANAGPLPTTGPRANRISIEVGPFHAEGDAAGYANLAEGFRSQIMIALSRFDEICAVLGAIPTRPSFGKPAPAQPFSPDLTFTGSIALLSDRLMVKAMLIQSMSGEVLWGQVSQRAICGRALLEIRDAMADQLVRQVSRPNGALQAAPRVEDQLHVPVDALHSLALLRRFRKSYRYDDHTFAREAAERLLKTEPSSALALACLAHLFSDSYRFGFTIKAKQAALKTGALSLAENAVGLAPNSSFAHHALGAALWLVGDVPASLRALQTAVALNPNDVEAATELGLAWSLLGKWDRALPLLEDAWALAPADTGPHRIGLSIYHFMNGRFRKALEHACAIQAPHVSHGYVLRAISQASLGWRADAHASIEHIVALGKVGVSDALFELGPNISPAITHRVAAALLKAGMTGESRVVAMPSSPAASGQRPEPISSDRPTHWRATVSYAADS